LYSIFRLVELEQEVESNPPDLIKEMAEQFEKLQAEVAKMEMETEDLSSK
jgi:hypothetical protein